VKAGRELVHMEPFADRCTVLYSKQAAFASWL